MAFNLPRLRRSVLRALAGRPVTLADVCERTWTVCPEARSVAPPALYPDGAVEKITQLSPFRTWEVEEPLIRGGEVVLKPTTGHLLRDVHVVAGYLYCGGFEWLGGYGESPWWLPPLKAEPPLDQATMVSTNSGTLYFGCLLLDDFPLELLSADLANNVSLLSKPSGHEAGYRALLGLPPKRVVQRARIREMTFFVDPAYNASKIDRYRQLRQALRRQVPASACSGRLYIRRGMAGQRRVMANEAELEAVLMQRGFTVIDPMQLSAAEVARMSLDAKVVVSIEGSQISHAIFSMADDAALVVLQPPDRFCTQYKEFTDAMGMRFGFVVCDPGEDGFSVNISELLHLLDRIEP